MKKYLRILVFVFVISLVVGAIAMGAEMSENTIVRCLSSYNDIGFPLDVYVSVNEQYKVLENGGSVPKQVTHLRYILLFLIIS